MDTQGKTVAVVAIRMDALSARTGRVGARWEGADVVSARIRRVGFRVLGEEGRCRSPVNAGTRWCA